MSARASGGIAIPGMILGFLERASIAYAATRDARRVPHLHWVCGWRGPGRTRACCAFLVRSPSRPRLLQDVRECPRIALTVEHIGPHETYQFKGDFAGSREPAPRSGRPSSGCRARFVRDVQAIETRFDFSAETLERYLGEPALAVLLRVHEIFRQTPGPGAGAPAGAPGGRVSARLPDEIRPVMESGIPIVLATCSADGEPNVSVVSQAYYVDPEHVAVSFQFFSKTIRNVRENPDATICLHDIWNGAPLGPGRALRPLRDRGAGLRADEPRDRGHRLGHRHVRASSSCARRTSTGCTSVECVPCVPE